MMQIIEKMSWSPWIVSWTVQKIISILSIYVWNTYNTLITLLFNIHYLSKNDEIEIVSLIPAITENKGFLIFQVRIKRWTIPCRLCFPLGLLSSHWWYEAPQQWPRTPECWIPEQSRGLDMAELWNNYLLIRKSPSICFYYFIFSSATAAI